MKKNLLFVTYQDEECDEGLSYAIDLAKIMDRGITILLVCKQKLMEKFENMMTAVTFAEAGEHKTAQELLSKNNPKNAGAVSILIEKCRRSGVDTNIQTTTMDIVLAIKDSLKHKNTVDMVLLSPSITNNGKIKSGDLQKLVRTASRPVVTMARHIYAA
ncbi:MAG: hypothetical protein HY806_07235 [Nitrospirae bacterium]|nr:hypothetical protein [Nitrospirota bacterium]MBI4838917.1 hypothetical protein [Nitrospirota bacterium]